MPGASAPSLRSSSSVTVRRLAPRSSTRRVRAACEAAPVTTLTAPAKINLALVVGPRREDGKHELLTVYERIGLADTLRLEPADGLEVDGFPATRWSRGL